MYVRMHACECGCMGATKHVWRSEANLGVGPHLPPFETGPLLFITECAGLADPQASRESPLSAPHLLQVDSHHTLSFTCSGPQAYMASDSFFEPSPHHLLPNGHKQATGSFPNQKFLGMYRNYLISGQLLGIEVYRNVISVFTSAK